MRKLALGLLIFIAGGGVGWYAYNHWGIDPGQAARPVNPDEAAITSPAAPGHRDVLARLLARNEFEAVLERYEALQVRASDAAVADARTIILSYARRLIEDRRFSLAEQLLQRFLVAAYRDVEARNLLAAAYHGRQDLDAAIDQLYEARGHAYRPAMHTRIAVRIRSTVAELTRLLKRNDDHYALLALYQRLTQLEPDHAPWFIGLADAQLALDDMQAARRSLQLVAQDSNVGEQARAMLAEIGIALTGMQDTGLRDPATGTAGIPLHRSGNHFIVDAIPAHGPGIRLLIDTGASLTIFTPGVLERRGIRYRDTGRTADFATANGAVRAPVYILDALSVGDWQVNQLEVGVLALAGMSGVDGLLGMNFLNQFRFFIDQDAALLRLSE